MQSQQHQWKLLVSCVVLRCKADAMNESLMLAVWCWEAKPTAWMKAFCQLCGAEMQNQQPECNLFVSCVVLRCKASSIKESFLSSVWCWDAKPAAWMKAFCHLCGAEMQSQQHEWKLFVSSVVLRCKASSMNESFLSAVWSWDAKLAAWMKAFCQLCGPETQSRQHKWKLLVSLVGLITVFIKPTAWIKKLFV
jgi:NADH pyrophosphatase NudC (nudix superfamily)